jgi:hypothetical protein
MKQPTDKAMGSVTARANRRPPSARAPAHWQPSAPPPPRAPRVDADADQPGGRNPVRYGDWEYKGLAIDF